MHVGRTVLARDPAGIAGEDQYGDPWALDVDDLVLVTHQESQDAVYRELSGDPERLARAGISAVHLIGDASSPRWISEAVFDGHRLAREIDGPDPAFPAPVLRDLPA